MPELHIVQGGIKNGDKKWLENAAKVRLDSKSWIAPKNSNPGDDVVIYIAGYGFFATAKIKSPPKLRSNWLGRTTRYGAALTSIRLIVPAISLGAIARNVPALTWAKYPRSITTPSPDVADIIRDLIHTRRKTGIPDLDDDSLQEANIDELRKVALLSERPTAPSRERKTTYRARSLAIKLYVLRRANGVCEGCEILAPFYKADGSPYLEPHHTSRLADEGPDHPAQVIALCPNCHRRAHYADDAEAFNKSLIRILAGKEGRMKS